MELDLGIRLLKEDLELCEKITLLDSFMHSPEYLAVAQEEKRLLDHQYNAMQDYHYMLQRRINLHHKTKDK
jgi:hypothetical protein